MFKKVTLSKKLIKNSKTVPYHRTLTRVEKGVLSRIHTKYLIKKPHHESKKVPYQGNLKSN